MADIIGKGKRFFERMQRRLIHARQTMLAKRHYYTSLQSYVYEHPDKAEMISTRIENLVYSPIGDYTSLHNGGQIIVKKARIKNARCFVYSDIIELEDGQCLYDLKEIECLRPIANYMDEILLKDTNKLCKIKKCRHVEHIEKAIKIGGMFGFNYYHFIFQLLPRMLEIADIEPSVPLILDYSARDIPSMKQLVDWCNTKHREIVYMEYDVAYNVDELYYITSPNMCVPNLKKKNGIYQIATSSYSYNEIQSLVDILIPYKSKSLPIKERIFISRRSSKRRKYNEDELWEIAKSYGFEKVFPEELNMAEQIALFNNAKMIIAANGAALTNLIFSRPNATLIMLCGSNVATPLFSSLMLMRKGHVIELHNDVKSKGYQGDFHIDSKDLEKAINTICK